MRGRLYSTDDRLPEGELFELVDNLACRIFHKIGRRAYNLGRRDVAELVVGYIDDLAESDRRAVPWMVWDLLQEGLELELEHA